MPWIYYPQADASLYGYVGDGILSSIVFFGLFVFSILAFRKKRFPKISTLVMMFLAILMIYFAYSKITGLQYAQDNFDVSNPIVSKATAGLQIGYGLYVLAISSLMSFLILMVGYYSDHFVSQTNEGKQNVRLGSIALVLAPVLFIFFYYFLQNPISSTISNEEIEISLTSEVSKMGKSLIDQDYETFVEYNHKTIVQSLGGKEQVKKMAKEAIDGLSSQGARIKDISLGQVLQSDKQGREIQAIIEQNTVILGNEGETSRAEKMLAVSKDMGQSWKFINLTGKTQQQILGFYPNFSKKLKI